VSKFKSFHAIAAKIDFSELNTEAHDGHADKKYQSKQVLRKSNPVTYRLRAVRQVVSRYANSLMPLRLLAENCGTPWRKIGLL